MLWVGYGKGVELTPPLGIPSTYELCERRFEFRILETRMSKINTYPFDTCFTRSCPGQTLLIHDDSDQFAHQLVDLVTASPSNLFRD